MGNPIDAQMVVVPNASGFGTWHNFRTQMNDSGELSISQLRPQVGGTFYDANGTGIFWSQGSAAKAIKLSQPVQVTSLLAEPVIERCIQRKEHYWAHQVLVEESIGWFRRCVSFGLFPSLQSLSSVLVKERLVNAIPTDVRRSTMIVNEIDLPLSIYKDVLGMTAYYDKELVVSEMDSPPAYIMPKRAWSFTVQSPLCWNAWTPPVYDPSSGSTTKAQAQSCTNR